MKNCFDFFTYAGPSGVSLIEVTPVAPQALTVLSFALDAGEYTMATNRKSSSGHGGKKSRTHSRTKPPSAGNAGRAKPEESAHEEDREHLEEEEFDEESEEEEAEESL